MNIMDELTKLTASVTGNIATKAKDQAISTLKDPEFKATVNNFTRDWFEEHKFILVAVFGSCLILSILAIANIISNFRLK